MNSRLLCLIVLLISCYNMDMLNDYGGVINMIKITADSTCDLSPDILNSFDITLTPLHVLIDDADYRDGINIAPQDIFEYVGKQNKTCTTAAINSIKYNE